MSPTLHLTLLALTWTLYALIHSALASQTSKAWVRTHLPHQFRAYRLAFNLIAGLLLIPPLWLLFSYPGEVLWRWPGVVGWLADAAALAAAAGFLWSLKIYDTGEFLGLRQLHQPLTQVDEPPALRLSWAHRFVRHPWYVFGLVIIWTREMNAALLVTAIILTLYVMLGSRREERDLIAVYGEQYRFYRRRVPALIPLPWKFLTGRQAQQILAMRGKR